MKNLFKSFLIMSITLASCQQEKSLITPDEKLVTSSENAREATLLPTIPKHYQLTKHGDIKLSYFADGRLQKVVYSPGQRGFVGGVYVQYRYGINSVSSTLYYDNKIMGTTIYLLDNAGRCYESRESDLIPYGGNAYVEKNSDFTYQYNAKGQLLTRTNKKNINEKTTFVWNADGDLTKLTGYNFNNGQAEESFKADFNLYYDQPTGDPILANLAPINCEAVNLPDPYLMIFGKTSKHLVKLVTKNLNLGGQYFNYMTNVDGYVTKREKYELSGAVLLETKVYDYLVTELTF